MIRADRVRSILTVLAFALIVSAAIAGPVVGQATPAPTPTENGSQSTPANGSAGTANGTETDVSIQTLEPGANSTTAARTSGNASASESPGETGTATSPPAGSGGSGGSGSGGGFGFGVPSPGDLANSTVDGVLSAINRIFVDTVGTILKLPWRFITVRFAPFESAAGSGEGAWSRPPGAFGEIYDLATGFGFQIALSLLGIVLVVDWFGNFSPKPGKIGPIDRALRRGGDVTHLAFSWPIIWTHFLLASILCVLFLPPDRVVVSGLTDYYSQLVGIASLIGFTLVFSIVLAVIGGYLLVKHVGAFITLLAGMVAYPILVALSIPDHWLFGSLADYAENSREGVIVAAWYPTPTAFVLGVGYWVDQAVLAMLTLGGPLGEISGGAIYYPVLWLVALYAPEKVFKDGNPARGAKHAALAAGTGGAAGAATGTAAGATAGSAAGSASGLAAGSGAGAAGALPAGAGAGAASGGAGSVASTASRMSSGSPGASALADGGTQSIDSASGGGGGAGPIGDSSAGAGATSSTSASLGDEAKHRDAMGGDRAAHNEAMGLDGSADPGQEPDGLTRVLDRGALDTGQRYEPLVQHESGELSRVDPPKDANWLADRGGLDGLDRGTDEPLYFRGETDGELYDLRGAAETGGVHGDGATTDSSDEVRGI